MDFNRLLEGFGVPIAILAVSAWALVKGTTVVWRDLVMPWSNKGLDRLIKFFDKLDGTLDCTLLRHKETVHASERLEDVLWQSLDRADETRELCERIAKAMDLPESSRSARRRRRRDRRPPPTPPAGGSTTSPPTSS